jgi:hypothetical protein
MGELEDEEGRKEGRRGEVVVPPLRCSSRKREGMASPYSHRAPSVDPHLTRTGEWDSPRSLPHPRTTHDSNTPLTATRGSPRTREGQLVKREKPVYSALKQQVLDVRLSLSFPSSFPPHSLSLEATYRPAEQPSHAHRKTPTSPTSPQSSNAISSPTSPPSTPATTSSMRSNRGIRSALNTV